MQVKLSSHQDLDHRAAKTALTIPPYLLLYGTTIRQIYALLIRRKAVLLLRWQNHTTPLRTSLDGHLRTQPPHLGELQVNAIRRTVDMAASTMGFAELLGKDHKRIAIVGYAP